MHKRMKGGSDLFLSSSRKRVVMAVFISAAVVIAAKEKNRKQRNEHSLRFVSHLEQTNGAYDDRLGGGKRHKAVRGWHVEHHRSRSVAICVD